MHDAKTGLAYAGKHGTDGFIPKWALSRINGRPADAAKLIAVRLWNEVDGGWEINGSAEARWHGNLNLRKDGLDVARLMSDCRNVMFSAGSACASGSGRPSHVLRAIGLTDAQAKSSIRLGWGRYTTMDELEQGIGAILEAAALQD